jgi:uncharacterized protein YlxW (UPF0749 family)
MIHSTLQILARKFLALMVDVLRVSEANEIRLGERRKGNMYEIECIGVLPDLGQHLLPCECEHTSII